MNTSHFRTALLVGAAIMALAAGCAPAHTSPTVNASLSSRGETDITVAALPTDDLAGLYVAQNDGLFAQQGLRVTIETIASSKAVIAAQLKGLVAIGAGSYVPYIAAQAAGARFRILAEASTLLPGTRVLVTAAGSRITRISDLVGKTIGVNGTNSIGTLLISELLEENGISPSKVHFKTDLKGFPDMPGQLQKGAWSAAFLAEPYVTTAEQDYGDQVLAELDQGAALNFPIDGYIATQAWATKYPRIAAAFARAIEEGQTLADGDHNAVDTAMSRFDNLPPVVTSVMAQPDFPIGPVDPPRIQRLAESMLEFGLLGRAYATQVERGTLVASLIAAG